MFFVIWWSIGALSYVLAMYIILRKEPNLINSLSEDDTLPILGSMVIAGIFGPLFTGLVTYWFWDAWVGSLPMDDDDKREFPWRNL